MCKYNSIDPHDKRFHQKRKWFQGKNIKKRPALSEKGSKNTAFLQKQASQIKKPRQSNLLTLCKQNHNTTGILFTNSKTTAGSPIHKNWRHRHRKGIFFIKNIIFLAGHTII